MRMAAIASGSSGNCTYIGTDRTHILIDAGISMKRTAEGLAKLGLCLSDIDAVFLTHEHSDHISGLPIIEKREGLDIYATAGTLEGVAKADKRGLIDPGLMHRITAGSETAVGDLVIRPFTIPHDAAEPVGYRVEYRMAPEVKKCAVATDIGHVTEEIRDALNDLDAFLLESNHDIRMLQTGPYPYPLKCRILGDTGHLSNDDAGMLVTSLLHDRLTGILLGHLSRENNLPDLAYETVRVEIELSDVPYHGNDFPIEVAPRDMLSTILEF